MKIPKNASELLDYLESQTKETSNLRDELYKDLMDRRIAVIRDRRIFFQNIALASATILGLASVFSPLSDKPLLDNYLIAGLFLHLGVMCVAFLSIRTFLDREQEDAVTTQDEYGELLEKKIELSQMFVDDALRVTNEKETHETLLRYFDRVKRIDSDNILKKHTDESRRQRELRLSGKADLEYYGELTIFLFVLGTVFIILAITSNSIHWVWLVSLSYVIFLICFKDMHVLMSPLFKIFSWLRRITVL